MVPQPVVDDIIQSVAYFSGRFQLPGMKTVGKHSTATVQGSIDTPCQTDGESLHAA
jgi:hypothetical protein